MKLTEIIVPGAIVPALRSTERDAVVGELIDAIVATGAAPASLRDELVNRVLERERRGSTGFGKGIAVPHVKHAAVQRMTAAVGLSQSGVDFNSLDKQPVYSIFLLLSPADRPDDHLHAMEVIFSNLGKDTFRRFLRQAGTTEEVWALLEEADNQKLPS